MSTTAAEPDAAPAGRPSPGPLDLVRKALKALASLQLTVVLFALAIGLVFFGTVAQVDFGLWTVVDKYFWSWVVWVPFDVINKFGQVFFGFPKGSHWGGSFPFPGGKLLGGAMLVNLLAAHLVRFRITWKRSGILLIHSGVILLFVGEFVTREFAVEQRMVIDQGSSVNYTQDARLSELAFVSDAGSGAERATVIPESKLKAARGRLTHPDLTVDVEVNEFMTNSTLANPSPDQPNPATAGTGLGVLVVRKREVAGTDADQRVDYPGAYVTLYRKGTDEKIGTYAVSPFLQDNPQKVSVDGKDYGLALRFKRYPKPYSIHLVEFRFDRYIGTNTPKNYSSKVILMDPELGVEREVVISMNHPLRHRGETFYQGGFDDKTEKTTILQVVRKPGSATIWGVPITVDYAACFLVALGMVVHFGIYLTQFLLRRAAA